MAKYIPAWQRVVLAALQGVPGAVDGKSAWDSLKQEEQQALRRFAAERNNNDADKAEALLAQMLPLVKIRRPMALWAAILLSLLAMAAVAMLALAFPPRILFVGMLALAFLELTRLLCSAKANKMARQWSRRDGSEEGAFKALKSMYYTALRSPVAAVNKFRTAAVLVVLAGFGLLLALPEPAPSEAKLLAEKVGEVTGGKAVMADALALLADTENFEGLEIIQQAMKYTAYGSDEEFLLAALMWMHIETRPDLMMNDYATGSTGKPMYAALKNTVPAQIDNAEEIAALEVLLGFAGAEAEAALTRFLGQKTLREDVLSAFGAAMAKGRTVEELLALGDGIAAAGHDPLIFLRTALRDVTFAEAESLIASADDEAHRTLLIRAIAPAITGSSGGDPDEVLAYLRLAKGYGVSAVECYPEGAAIIWDTSRCAPYTSPRAQSLGDRDTFLVIRRTEKPEPYTTITVAEEEETGHNQSLPDGLYADYDPDAADGAAQYTVVLETHVLDRMPPERIPQTIADCDALVILDAWYWCDGYVRFSRSIAEDGGWRRSQVDSPTYGVCQEIAVYSAQSGQWLFSYKENAANSPAMLEENLASKRINEWQPIDHYIAAPDERWMNTTYADFLYSLERRNWLLVP